MKDSLLDWIEDHRKLVIFLFIVVILIGVLFGIRTYNLSHKDNKVNQEYETSSENLTIDSNITEVIQETTTYDSTLNNKDDIKRPSSQIDKNNLQPTDEVQEIKPNFDVSCKVFGHTSVPQKMVDGSSCIAYLNSVSLSDFNTFWGTSLDVNDMKSTTKYLVGVDQDGIEEEIADLQSVGWLISNFNNLNKNDAIKFTNLHVIGSLSSNHVAVLCSYDWYSAYGLKDTLVFFEDISGTLNKDEFSDGAIFSATVFVHNIKVIKVNGQNVVCVQYNVFK